MFTHNMETNRQTETAHTANKVNASAGESAKDTQEFSCSLDSGTVKIKFLKR